MDRQVVTMQGGGAGAPAHHQEWFYAGGGGEPVEQAVIVDGAFLMELLEDAPAADHAAPEDVERLSRVIRSLEAEIGGGGGGPPPSAADGGDSTAEHVSAGDDVDGMGLEEYMLLDLDSIAAGPCVATEAPFEYWTTTEVPPALGHEMGGWYVDGDGNGVMVGYEFRDQCYYGYSESPHLEHVYSPLWE
ncbi:unnamed protein product [Urochloa decumbens]|uniref:Uncharacterized protein n=1 Tax=Urochloa decumbens TaxID=240449 RepID=A0ABC9E8Z8_9POAL